MTQAVSSPKLVTISINPQHNKNSKLRRCSDPSGDLTGRKLLVLKSLNAIKPELLAHILALPHLYGTDSYAWSLREISRLATVLLGCRDELGEGIREVLIGDFGFPLQTMTYGDAALFATERLL